MKYQLKIATEKDAFTVFLEHGTLYPFENSIRLHYHLFTEFHIVLNGEYEYNVHGKTVTLSKGDIAVFPPNVFHKAEGKSENSRCIAFQVSKVFSEFTLTKLNSFYCTVIDMAITEFLDKKDANQLRSMILLVIGSVEGINLPDFEPIQDKNHIIESFLSANFSNEAKLSELASLLGVCEKQASRLVKKHTGNDFKCEISRRRVESAIRLMNDTDMTLEEISLAVGYKSYSSLWKAINKSNIQNSKTASL